MKSTLLKDTYFNPNPGNTAQVVNLLLDISGKSLSIAAIKDNIFKLVKTSVQSQEQYIRITLQSFTRYLQYLVTHEPQSLELHVPCAIADIAPYVRFRSTELDMDWIKGTTNTQPAAITFKQTKYLFYHNQIREDFSNRYHLDHTVIFGLRNALEQRIKGILGIDVIETEKGHYIGLAGLIELLIQLRTITFDERINWQHIQKVNKWLNHHLHRGLRPSPWIIFEAMDTLDVLLVGGTYPDGKGASWYIGTTTASKEQLRAEILEIVNRNNRPRVKWLDVNEVLELKHNGN